MKDYITIGIVDGKPIHLGYTSGEDALGRAIAGAESYCGSPGWQKLTAISIFQLYSPFKEVWGWFTTESKK